MNNSERSHEFTQGNHLRHGFIDSAGTLRPEPSEGSVFYVAVGDVSHAPGTPLAEGARAARMIRNSTSDEIWLCMSGGVDSESMARCFLAAGVEFRVAIMRFDRELNWYDIRDAVAFCDRMQIPYRFFDLDVREFYLGGRHFELARKYRCRSPQLTTHLHLMDAIPGFPVLSWNVTCPYISQTGRASLLVPSDLYFCYERFLLANKRQGAPLFFLYSPELFFSFLRLPMMQDFLRRTGDWGAKHQIDYQMKCDTYRAGGFSVVNREDKFTGFETVKQFFAEYYGGDLTTFDQKFRQPLERELFIPQRTVFQLDWNSLFVSDPKIQGAQPTIALSTSPSSC